MHRRCMPSGPTVGQDHAVPRPSEGNPQCPLLTTNARRNSSSGVNSSALIDYGPAAHQCNAKCRLHFGRRRLRPGTG